ncbi:hypothetical protein HPB49_009886 [Dermacentor silvarum]|uniref:Uncharacterized protein n=1 Tax=Dermacentor silvarum TaxID=543639 RepID=A0ACB8DYY7_DERSI|nr:hypothetical protein HPB49_009886 [Dermacentor silvarum]
MPAKDTGEVGAAPLPSLPSRKPTTKKAQNRRLFDAVTQRVASLLPPPCFLLLGAAGGVIGINASGCPVELERGEGVSGMLLPARLPEGVRAQPFLVRRDHISPENRPNDWFATDMFKNLVGLPVGEEAVDVKCVLWFTVSDVAFGENYQLMYDMVTDVVASCGMRRFALGGAVLEQMTVNNGLNGIDHSILCAGLCFSGDSVRSASKVVSPSVKGAETVERELTKFRLDSGFDSWDKSCTFGFMFACVARGARHHGKTNVEADAFARVFPGVPLMGVFGNGEIGVNYLPTDQQLLGPVPLPRPWRQRGRHFDAPDRSLVRGVRFVVRPVLVYLQLYALASVTMPGCCVPQCTNHSRNGWKLYRFPRDPIK